MSSTVVNEMPSPEHDQNIHALLKLVVLRAIYARQPSAEGTDEELPALLRSVCAVARDQNMYAERVLVMLKQTWRQYAESELITRPTVEDALNSLVGQCIREYYNPGRDQ